MNKTRHAQRRDRTPRPEHPAGDPPLVRLRRLSAYRWVANHIFRTVRLILVASMILVPTIQAQASEHVEYWPLGEITYAIQLAIRDATRANTKPPYFLVTHIDLDVKLRKTIDTNVTLGLPIFSLDFNLGSSEQTTAVERLQILIKAATKFPTRSPPELDLTSIVDQITHAFSQGGTEDAASDLPKLTVDKFRYNISWTIQKDAGGNARFVILSAGGSAMEQYLHSLTFHFCRTVNRANCIPGTTTN